MKKPREKKNEWGKEEVKNKTYIMQTYIFLSEKKETNKGKKKERIKSEIMRERTHN